MQCAGSQKRNETVEHGTKKTNILQINKNILKIPTIISLEVLMPSFKFLGLIAWARLALFAEISADLLSETKINFAITRQPSQPSCGDSV